MIKNNSGIYIIQNIITKDFYLGSSWYIDNRFRNHRSLLKKNKHHSIILQRAWNKYKKKNFIMILFIKEDNIDDLRILEQFCLDFLNPRYNVAKNVSSVMKGRKHSKDSIKKMSGKIPWNKGIPRTKKEKKLISIKRKKAFINMSKEKKKIWIENLKKNPNSYWKGKKIPKEQILKMKRTLRKKYPKIECSNGIIYESQLDASKQLCIKQGHISEALRNKRLAVKSYYFRILGSKNILLTKFKDHNGCLYKNVVDFVNKYKSLTYQPIQVSIHIFNIISFFYIFFINFFYIIFFIK